MAVTARTQDGAVTFSHPDRPDLTIDPATQGAALVDWIAPLYPAERPAPRQLVQAPETGMADVEFPSVSIMGCGSLDALTGVAGQPMDMRRFRGNLWVEGLAPFAEFDWIGQH